MAKFLLWMSPQPGHILPTLGLASALNRRGHRVIYHTCGRICQELEGWNFETVRSFAGLPMGNLEASVTRRTEPAAVLEAKIRQCFLGEEDYYSYLRDDLLRALRCTEADVLIVDGIKDWRLTKGAPNFYFDIMQHVSIGRLCVHLRATFDNDFRSEKIPLIFLCSPEFELPHFVEQRAVYGDIAPLSIEGGDCGTKSETIHGLVYVTFGSQMAQYKNLDKLLESIAAVADADRSLSFILNLDKKHPRWNRLFGAHSSQVELSSHSTSLRHASALICHGGLGTIKDAVRATIPMIVVPQMWDQPMNAVRVASHGLGVTMDPNQINPRKLESAIANILDSEQFHICLTKMRRAFSKSYKEKLAVIACERLAQ